MLHYARMLPDALMSGTTRDSAGRSTADSIRVTINVLVASDDQNWLISCSIVSLLPSFLRPAPMRRRVE